MRKTSAERRVLIVGAGAAGLSAALQLQRRGFSVTVIEESSPGSGASYGNSGMLVADTAIPTFQPGMIWKVPGWLADPLGPLTVKAAYLPRALPWLWRYLRLGTRANVLETAEALRPLHRYTLDGWRDNIGDEAMARLTRQDGQVYLWERMKAPPARSLEDEVRARFGIESDALGSDRIRQYFPGISREVSHGLLIPGNGHTVNPRGLVGALTETFRREGDGALLHERALRIWREGDRWTVMTNLGNHGGEAVVVAAGAWSGRLLAPLGVAIPLETERGYHVMLSNPSVRLGMPILNKSRYFGMSSMSEGLRVSGTVEIAGLDAPPTLARARVLTAQAKRLFPDLTFDEEAYWMGHRPSIPDGLPAIGEIPGQPGLYACFGHGHSGMTAAPASGRLLAELMAGERPTIDPAAYSPARFS
ncbi:FAD-binding oxidoreductase [Bosea sp. (in: a-proteobacteria)]|uniref:NAD(P)/FAD-dependent oxidoreductase n=1 Tax=Bosea sp. (in: a-proteobacteria) TaxID=1871050 RepID=UPI00260E33A9|nr:FAD-binding oxidoreductase [Bosea sp. (in: a-proteobacteria)]MCO5090173.1 FAD-binding oxidoreductase [Bosea sp. (in: a-proteobacteria)]